MPELPYRFVVTLKGGAVLRVMPEDFGYWSDGRVVVKDATGKLRTYPRGSWQKIETESGDPTE